MSTEVIERGISEVQLPARFDFRRNIFGFDGIPYLIIDGAHTERSVAGAVKVFQAIRQLESVKNAQDSCLTDFTPGAEPILLCTTGGDKPLDGRARELRKAFDVVIFTTLLGRDALPERVSKAFSDFREISFIKNPREAIRFVLKRANDEQRPLVVMGPLYLAGEVYLELERKATEISQIFR